MSINLASKLTSCRSADYPGVLFDADGWRVIVKPSGRLYSLQCQTGLSCVGPEFSDVISRKSPLSLADAMPRECPIDRASVRCLPASARDAATVLVLAFEQRKADYIATDWTRPAYAWVIASTPPVPLDLPSELIGLRDGEEVRFRVIVEPSRDAVQLQVYLGSVGLWEPALIADSVPLLRWLLRPDFVAPLCREAFDYFPSLAVEWREACASGLLRDMVAKLPDAYGDLSLSDMPDRPRPLCAPPKPRRARGGHGAGRSRRL